MSPKSARIILAQLRQDLGYDQADLAGWIGVDIETYSAMEAGALPLTADDFLYLMRKLTRRGSKKGWQRDEEKNNVIALNPWRKT